MARVLEDGRDSTDLSEKIKDVLVIVPHRSEEEICIALHDADYDKERAITTLLDTESSSGVKSITIYEVLLYVGWLFSGPLAVDARGRRSQYRMMVLI